MAPTMAGPLKEQRRGLWWWLQWLKQSSCKSLAKKLVYPILSPSETASKEVWSCSLFRVGCPTRWQKLQRSHNDHLGDEDCLLFFFFREFLGDRVGQQAGLALWMSWPQPWKLCDHLFFQWKLNNAFENILLYCPITFSLQFLVFCLSPYRWPTGHPGPPCQVMNGIRRTPGIVWFCLTICAKVLHDSVVLSSATWPLWQELCRIAQNLKKRVLPAGSELDHFWGSWWTKIKVSNAGKLCLKSCFLELPY